MPIHLKSVSLFFPVNLGWDAKPSPNKTIFDDMRHKSHIIIYRVTPHGIRVLRVLHQAEFAGDAGCGFVRFLNPEASKARPGHPASA